ncbi:hypothetical protein O181_072947 [Austropuccinia psidii MF-1]|uniref:Uncharacterized protein n=1 Tax=Austropuccinia psidii MF-1 TaxID=1389203 RepID=A0A9Q3IAK9_9BASI|nr:hypothetical protein [Austropuccinia psidii MF-1]
MKFLEPRNFTENGSYKILKKCGKEMEHGQRRRCTDPFSTEEYINAPDNIVTRIKIGRKWKKLDTKSPNKRFILKDKPTKTFKTNIPNTNEQRNFHKCGGIGNLAKNCLIREKINEIVERECHND